MPKAKSQKPFLLIANFKSHKTVQEVKDWIAQVGPVAKNLQKTQIIVAPSFVHLPPTINYEPLTVAAQDVSPFPMGSYTGAVNATQLSDLGVTHAIIGHSERRRYFHETHSEVANKAKELLAQDMTPILCMSEQDLNGQFAALQDVDLAKIIFAYEPPGDIGGTQTAPPDQIKQVIERIEIMAPVSNVIYGGSVNATDVAPLISTGISGAIVGTASLAPSDFIALIHALES